MSFVQVNEVIKLQKEEKRELLIAFISVSQLSAFIDLHLEDDKALKWIIPSMQDKQVMEVMSIARNSLIKFMWDSQLSALMDFHLKDDKALKWIIPSMSQVQVIEVMKSRIKFMSESQLSALNNDETLKLIIPSLSQVQVNEVMKLRKGEDKFLNKFNYFCQRSSCPLWRNRQNDLNQLPLLNLQLFILFYLQSFSNFLIGTCDFLLFFFIFVNEMNQFVCSK